MNQVMEQQNNNNNLQGQDNANIGNNEPGSVNLQIRIQYGSAGTVQMKMALDEATPLSVLIDLIKNNLFAQNMPSQFEETIIYIINEIQYNEKEQKSLRELHVTDNTIIDVKLQYKGGLK